jgi:hypothetical protein
MSNENKLENDGLARAARPRGRLNLKPPQMNPKQLASPYSGI